MTDLTAGRRHPGPNVDLGPEEENARNEKVTFGFWVFLMSDAVAFALLFATWAVMWQATDGGPTTNDVTDLGRSFIETMVLLSSSLVCGLMTITIDADRRRGVVAAWLAGTLALGFVFLGLEYSELSGLVADGHGPDRSGMLSSFFLLVGTHGLHVSVGAFWGLVLLAQIAAKGLVPAVTSRLVRFALYWHFLDIVWIGIFSFVYLAGSL